MGVKLHHHTAHPHGAQQHGVHGHGPSARPGRAQKLAQLRLVKAGASQVSADTFVRPATSAPAAAPAALAPEPEPKQTLPILLYNGDCAVCRRIAAWVQAAEAKNPGGVNLIEKPIGDDPDALLALNPNLNIWDAYSAVHVLMPDGSMRVGGEAVAEVLKRLPNTAWFGQLFDVEVFGKRPFQALLNGGYYVLDKVRPALGCESCGERAPVWARPLEWAVKGYKALFGKGEAAAHG